MNEDKLKKWIREEREGLESETPRDGLWEAIATELREEKAPQKSRFKVWHIAAAIAALMLLAIGYQSTRPALGMAEESELEIEGEKQDVQQFLSEEMYEAQSFYARQVDDKMSKLAKYPVDADLKEEMDLLTEEFEQLQKEMGQGMDDSKVVEAMIDNYRLRLDLLGDLLEALDKGASRSEKNKTDGHEI